MAIKGYTNKADVAKYLGRTFNADEQAICDEAIEAAEEVIDGKISFPYAVGGTQTARFISPSSAIMQVRAADISAISAVRVYSAFTAAAVSLVANTDYHVQNLAAGLLYIPGYRDYYLVEVDYTTTIAVPKRVKLAANMIVAHWMRPILNDEVPGLANYSVGGEFTVAFTRHVQETGLPEGVDTLLEKDSPKLYIG